MKKRRAPPPPSRPLRKPAKLAALPSPAPLTRVAKTAAKAATRPTRGRPRRVPSSPPHRDGGTRDL